MHRIAEVCLWFRYKPARADSQESACPVSLLPVNSGDSKLSQRRHSLREAKLVWNSLGAISVPRALVFKENHQRRACESLLEH